MIGRLLTRIVDAQAGWAKPFGEFNHRWLSALFRPIRPVKDFLNGTWLGHPVHSALTDVPIGALTVALVLDILGQPRSVAADVALLVAVLSIIGAAVTGLADYTDTDGTARMRATVHAVVMTTALVLLTISLVIRAGNPVDRTVPFVLLVVGYLVIAVGAAIGGDLVFLIGTHVNRHAWRGAGTKWVALDLGDAVGHSRGWPDEGEGGRQHPDPGAERRNDPRAPRDLCPCRRPACRGHARRRLHPVPLARLPVPPRERPRRPRPGDVRPARLRGPPRRVRRRLGGTARAALT